MEPVLGSIRSTFSKPAGLPATLQNLKNLPVLKCEALPLTKIKTWYIYPNLNGC